MHNITDSFQLGGCMMNLNQTIGLNATVGRKDLTTHKHRVDQVSIACDKDSNVSHPLDTPAGCVMNLKETTGLDASGYSDGCLLHPSGTDNRSFIESPHYTPFINNNYQYIRSSSKLSYIQSRIKEKAAIIL